MKDEEQARSFSFHLSASAPPAEVDERASDSGPSWFSPDSDQLDLDLDAFAPSAPAPDVASPLAPLARPDVLDARSAQAIAGASQVPAGSQLVAEPQVLAPQPMAAAEAAPGTAAAAASSAPTAASAAASAAPPSSLAAPAKAVAAAPVAVAPAALAKPPVTAPSTPAAPTEPVAAPAPRISADDVTRTPAPVDATSPPPPTTSADRVVAGPAVRRVRFPSTATTTRAAAARHSETVFSTSLSQAPRARLESNDDNELEGSDAHEALPPEDLPLSAPQARTKVSSLRPSAAPDRSTRSATAQRAARSSSPRKHGADKPAAAAVSALGELARKGALLGRRGTEHGARLAKDASERARELWSSGRERALAKLAERRAARDSSSVAAVPSPAPGEDAALAPESHDPREQQFSEQATPSRRRSLSDLRGPWLSGGAALLAAGICYVGASRLVAAHGPGASSASLEATTEQATESPAEPEDAVQERVAPEGAALPRLPALAKGIPVDRGASQEATDEDAEPEPPAPPTGKPSRKQPATPAAVETLALPEGMSWPDKGLIEVVTEGRELVYVDGVFTGRGPLRRIPIQPGSHEVVVRTEGQERNVRLDVSTGKRARVVFGS